MNTTRGSSWGVSFVAPTPTPAVDYDAGAAFCEVLGTLAFTDFRWSGQPQVCTMSCTIHLPHARNGPPS